MSAQQGSVRRSLPGPELIAQRAADPQSHTGYTAADRIDREVTERFFELLFLGTNKYVRLTRRLKKGPRRAEHAEIGHAAKAAEWSHRAGGGREVSVDISGGVLRHPPASALCIPRGRILVPLISAQPQPTLATVNSFTGETTAVWVHPTNEAQDYFARAIAQQVRAPIATRLLVPGTGWAAKDAWIFTRLHEVTGQPITDADLDATG